MRVLAATIVAAGIGAAEASTYVPVPHVFADGSSLVSIAGEGLSPDRYDPWNGAKVGPAPSFGAPGTSGSLPCRPIRDAQGIPERERPENRIYCGWPAVESHTPRVAAPPLPWAGGSGGCRSCDRPSPVAPVPLPAAGWLLVCGLAAMAALRGRAAL